ncbi:MAG: alanine/glycine:cation symporter family protein [Phycisphaerae bacterium]
MLNPRPMLAAGFAEALNDFSNWLSGFIWSTPLFFLLLGCGLVFSILSKFVQWRVLTHGVACIRGDYDRPEDAGQINHFQALCAALSATIGIGNIGGVAVAISLGGPGAIFWMWVVGLFGMALKFMECTLAVMFRDVRDVPDPGAPAAVEHDIERSALAYGDEPEGSQATARGEVRGGPMWYIERGLVDPLKARGNPFWMIFKLLAILFAFSAIFNSFGGGNLFQGWNVADSLQTSFGVPRLVSACIVSALVAFVIIGGIKRIGNVASKLVPFMCILYVAGALIVVVLNAAEIPKYLAMIIQSAFTPTAGSGAFIGTTVWVAFEWGLRRACFSNEAGEGSAAIAHSAAKTDEPIREGVVAGIGPFVDTIIICTMTALVLLTTGAWERPQFGTVASFDPNSQTAVVSLNSDLGPRWSKLYAASLAPASKLGIYVATDPSAKLEVANAEIPRPANSDALFAVPQWDAVKEVSVDYSSAVQANKDRIEVGQPVHLNLEGASLTSFAFDTSIPGFGTYIVTLGVCLFAFSTMISWSYYGEKASEYLFGPASILFFKFVFVIVVFLGMVIEKFETVFNLSDATAGMMVLCNLPAVILLSPAVIRAARHYFRRLDSGDMPPVRKQVERMR